MKSLITNITGGFPLRISDIGFVQEGMIEQLKALSRMQYGTNDTFIWVGNIVLNNNTLSHTEGLIYYVSANELFYITSGVTTNSSFAGNPSNVYLTMTETNDSAGLKVFKDGQSFDTYNIRQISFGSSTSSDKFYNLTLQHLINQRINSLPSYTYDNGTMENMKRRNQIKDSDMTSNTYSFDTSDTLRLIGHLRITPSVGNVGVRLPGYTNVNLVTEGESLTISNVGATSTNLMTAVTTTATTLYAGETAELYYSASTWNVLEKYYRSTSWNSISLQNNWSGSLSYRFMDGYTIQLKGRLQKTSSTSNAICGVIPDAASPDTTSVYTVATVLTGATVYTKPSNLRVYTATGTRYIEFIYPDTYTGVTNNDYVYVNGQYFID